ncbi:hypothetical protein [Desulfosporosinus youngiae]|uniref:Uncharacterized protein n=1 Tax=Desulfosporosinus youngiae DSM 17734 TaxID=768710 RepID=H5Y2P7_9FIRM|nr:hypothetical protein [Desulfosporosinus youngiae]EHQ88310.1 hypothetical protein DesyoDRAFT_1140 [Desulfosporosinus youngiae DSM 17734]
MKKMEDNKTFSNEKMNSLMTFLERTKDGEYSKVSSPRDRINIGIYQTCSEEQYFYGVR